MADELKVQASSCKSCGAAIYWALTYFARRPMPIDVVPVENGNQVLTLSKGELIAQKYVEQLHRGRRRFVSHFATCKHGAEWRRPELTKHDFETVQRNAMQADSRRSRE